MALWAELPSHLMGLILKRLPLLDYIRCRAVCRSWIQACKEEPPSKRQPPLLLFPPPADDNNNEEFLNLLGFLGPQSNMLHRIPIPEIISNACFVGSCNGWIVTCDTNAVLRLFNPLSGSLIDSLPTVSIILEQPEDAQGSTPAEIIEDYFQRVVVFPLEGIASIVVFIINTYWTPHVAFAVPGDESWTFVDHFFSGYSEFFEDVTLHNGQFYAVTNLGTLVQFNLKHNKPRVVVSPRRLPHSDSTYLFESLNDDSELMLLKEFKYLDFNSYVIMRSFRVFRLCREKAEWIEVESLGEEGMALFVGLKSQPILMSTHYFPEVEGDCVYFTAERPREDECTTGRYNLRDKSIQPLVPHKPFKRCWFMPSLF